MMVYTLSGVKMAPVKILEVQYLTYNLIMPSKEFISFDSINKILVVSYSVCRLNYLLAGGLNPIGFHVLNIILHAAVSAFMIDVFAILTGGLAYDEKGRMCNLAPKTSLLAGLFFAAHPIHTESVSRNVKHFLCCFKMLF